MNVEDVYNYCRGLKGAKEEFPFDDKTLVFKVQGKIFILIPLEKADSIAVKCHPQTAVALREQWQGVTGAFHMNKKHWNAVALNQQIPEELIKKWIDDSYYEVVQTFTKKQKDALENLS